MEKSVIISISSVLGRMKDAARELESAVNERNAEKAERAKEKILGLKSKIDEMIA